MNKAVFLDRDGTINEDKGYINHPSRIEILPGVIPAIKILNRSGLKVIIVSNQSGIARGFFSVSTLKKINSKLLEIIESKGAHIDGMYNCYHSPDGKIKEYAVKCSCRKPGTGMAKSAQKKFNIDLKKSFMIGDKISDIEFGHNFGGKSIFILTGYGLGDWEYNREKILKVKPDFVARDMLVAAKWIMKNI